MEMLEDPELELNSLKCSHYHFKIKAQKYTNGYKICQLALYRGIPFVCLMLDVFILQYALLINPLNIVELYGKIPYFIIIVIQLYS